MSVTFQTSPHPGQYIDVRAKTHVSGVLRILVKRLHPDRTELAFESMHDTISFNELTLPEITAMIALLNLYDHSIASAFAGLIQKNDLSDNKSI